MANNWIEYPVCDFAQVIGGGTPSTSNSNNFEGEIPWITPKDLSNFDFRFIHRGERNISKIGLENSNATLLPAGTILLSSRAPIGYLAIAANPLTTNQGFKNLVIKQGFCNLFIYYLLKANIDYLISQASGTTFSELSGKTLSKIKFNIPSFPQQEKIAEILGALDDKIEHNRRMNRTLQEMAQVLYQEMINNHGKSMRVGTIAEDFNLTMGQSPPGDTYNEEKEGIPFFQGNADFEFRYPKNRVYCTSPTRYAKSGDTLVSVRAPVGDVNMAEEECAIGRGLAAIRHKTGSRSYTYYVMKSLRDSFSIFESEGTVFGSINKTDFQNLEIPIPTADQVKQFEERCFPIDQMIENNEKQSQILINIRDYLLPRLMSGNIRL